MNLSKAFWRLSHFKINSYTSSPATYSGWWKWSVDSFLGGKQGRNSHPSKPMCIQQCIWPSPPSHYYLQNSWNGLSNSQPNNLDQSRKRPDPGCERCGRAETMEHLLCECEYYSEPLWNRLGSILTKLFNNTSTDQVPRVDLGPTNIIYNIPHPSILLHIPHKTTRNTLLLLTQEVKRDIYRRMNLPPSAQKVTDPWRLVAHLDSTLRILHSYLRYIGMVKWAKATETLLQLQEINMTWWNSRTDEHAFSSAHPWH